VASIASDDNLQYRYLAHNWAFLAPNVSEVANRPIMKPINLIHPFQASFLHHQLSSVQRTLFRWLEYEPDPFVAGELPDERHEDRHESNQTGHVAIVAAHVSCSYVFGLVWKIFI
jgi:hypothetical protein